MTSSFAIKGTREGLLITLGDQSWPEALRELEGHLEARGDFFRGAKVAVRLGGRALRAAELIDLRNRFAERGIALWAALSEAPGTMSAAQSLGLATVLPAPAEEEPPLDTELSGSGAVLVQRTLHSGNRLDHPGHVIVIGDVNPGAEIIAGGNIIVWGKLRGTVHAGAQGDETAVVCALDLSPTQLRIAGFAATSPPRRGKPQPEMARLKGSELIAEVWTPSPREGK